MVRSSTGKQGWHFWAWLTRPDKNVLGYEARQQATLLAALSLALFLASLVNAISWTTTSLMFAAAPYIAAFTSLGLLLVYLLSRTRHYRTGALLLNFILVLGIGVIVFFSSGPITITIHVLYFLVLIILLTSLLLSVRTLLVISVICFVLVSSTFFIPAVSAMQSYSLVLFTTTMSALLIIATITRNNFLSRLHASEERFRHLTQNSPDTIYVFNLTNYQIEYINRDHFLGYSLEELQKPNSILDQVYPDDYPAVINFWHEVGQQETSETKAIDYRVQKTGGEWEWVHNRVTPLSFAPEGKPEQILVVLTVITERKQAEDLLQSVAAAAPNAMVVTDDEGNILYANAQVTTIFGYHFHELTRQTINIFIPERFHSNHFSLYTRYFENPTPRPMGHGRYLLGRHRDGQEIPVEIALNPITTQTGRRILVSMTDITERQRAELTIRQQAEYLRILLEQTPIGIITVNKDGHVTDANARSLQILDVETQTQAESLNVFTLPALVNTDIVSMFVRVLHTGQQEEKEIWYTSSQNKKNYLLVRAVPHVDGHGQRIGLIILAEDLTQRVQAEEGMRQMQKMESLGVLAGGIAHDFNNLLVAMLGQTSLALAKSRPESLSRPHIQKAVTAAERAAQLTQQLLAYSGRGQFQVAPLNLNSLIEENSHLFAATIPKHIHLRTSLSNSLPLIEADLAQMQQVIMNLIINAAEAIGDKSGTITIVTDVQHLEPNDHKYWHYTVTPMAPGPYVTLELHDDGSGITSQTLSRIFDPFFTTKPTGHGLGLAAVIGIVKGHRGGLTVYSEVGKGTTFKLLLPSSGTTSIPDKPDRAEESGILPGRVLVIDDEATVRDAVIDILGLAGVDVIAAADGETGLALYQTHMADIFLVVLDLSMPGWSGEQTLRELRQVNPEVRIILSSGYNEIEATQRFVGKALTGFLQKPYSAETLLSAVKQHLTRSPG